MVLGQLGEGLGFSLSTAIGEQLQLSLLPTFASSLKALG